MRKTRRLAILASLAIALCPSILKASPTALDASAPRAAFLELDPGFAEIGALVDPLDNPRLEYAALLASGVAPERLEPYEARLGGIFAELGAETGRLADPSARAEAVLTFLHKHVMRAYREDATTLDGILDTGLYNCVSSAVLYTLAARSLGIDAAGVRTRDHAFSRVLVGGRSVDVETTNPFGYDPGGKKEFKDSFGSVTGFAYVAPGGYGDRRSIGAGDLVGLILSNRAAALERSGRFAESARLGADYASLCPGPDTRAFLVDRINNLVAGLESRGDYAAAEASAKAASAALPADEHLASLARTASYNRAAALTAKAATGTAGDREAAFEAAALAASVLPPDKAGADLVRNALLSLAQGFAQDGAYEAARRAVAERAGRAGPSAAAAADGLVGELELVRAANGLPFAEAAAVADRIFAAGEVSAPRYAQAIAAIYGNEAGRIGSRGNWLKGAALAELGAAKAGSAAPGEGNLTRLAQNLRRNFVAEAHNRFAALYNSGDYPGAKAALTEALAAMPEDASLARDLATVEAALGR